jgi:site-specific DNA recombinase
VTAKVHAEVQGQVDRLAEERRDVEKDLARSAAEVKRIVGATGRSKASATTARLAELQDRLTTAEQRLAEIHAQETALNRDQVDETDLAAAMTTFDPIWETLTPREQARIIHLLVDRVAFDGSCDTVAITFRPSGIRTLAQEVA